MGFGDFNSICKQAPLPLCSLVGRASSPELGVGISTDCYARNIRLANTVIFEVATCFAHIAALLMTSIMLFHVHSKFTAVGRKEISSFFYAYMLLTFVSLCVDSGVVPPGSDAYTVFAALQAGLASATCACLLVNGFVGFQLYEDGTALSVWLLRTVSFLFFLTTFLVALGTFKGWSGLGPANTVGLFVVLYLFPALCLLVYVVMQLFLVLNTLEDRWPLGDVAFATGFLVTGQVVLYAFSNTICSRVQHYLDALFFSTIANLFAVMMIYKYWDSITKEDLEFSVGTKVNNWEVKDPLPDLDPRPPPTFYQNSEYAASFGLPAGPAPRRTSAYASLG